MILLVYKTIIWRLIMIIISINILYKATNKRETSIKYAILFNVINMIMYYLYDLAWADVITRTI